MRVVPDISLPTVVRDMKGGHRRTSTSGAPFRVEARALARVWASATVVFIFQLPAIRGSRVLGIEASLFWLSAEFD